MPTYDDFDEADDPGIAFRPPAGPGVVRAAGVLWLVVGTLGLVQAGLHLFVNMLAVVGRQSPFTSRDPVGCCLGTVFAVGVLVTGFRTLAGTASRDWVLAGAICSLAFGVMSGCMGFASWSLTRHIPVNDRGAVFVLAGVAAVQGVILLVAGALALSGQRAYADWKRKGF